MRTTAWGCRIKGGSLSHLADVITATELILPYEIRSPWFPRGSLQHQVKLLTPEDVSPKNWYRH